MKLSHIERKYENFDSHFLKCFKTQENFIRSGVYFYLNEEGDLQNKKKERKHIWRKQVSLFRENIFGIIFKI